MGNLINRSLDDYYPRAVSAEGVYVTDEKGNRYLDGSSGAGVSCLGHGNQEVVEAMHEQAKKITFASSVFYTTDIAEELATTLVQTAPKGLNQATFGCGGSEQVESAMKLARQYHVDRGTPSKSIIIGRDQSYHGMTLATLNVGGHAQRRQLYQPMFAPTYLIAPHFEYRHKQPHESLNDYSLRVANELETKILEVGAENIAAFLCEPVVGATTGCVPANKIYFQRIREICDAYDVLLILDEIFCGMGRTGTLYACEQDGVIPDIVVMAKGLGGGYQPISAMLVSDPVIDAIRNGRGYVANGHTYMNHPVNCAAALAVQHIMQRDNLLANVNKQGLYLRGLLEKTFKNHPNIGDIRGRGLMLAMEFVQDKDTKQPFNASDHLWRSVQKNAMALGLMCYPNQGTANGQVGDHVILAPPYIISQSQCDELVAKLDEAIALSLKQINA